MGPGPTEPKPVVDLWASFLAHEKIEPKSLVDPRDVTKLLDLCNRLAELDRPRYRPYKARIETRKLVCNTAMDMGFDLLALKRRKPTGRGTKPTIGRGLLDTWNEVYKQRFGSTVGTAGAQEIVRRKVVGKLSEEMRKDRLTKREESR